MDKTHISLYSHYKYWDDYVSRWFMCDASCCSYLPEPWWGWSPLSGKPLYSVVINLNPGKGGTCQTRGSLSTILKNRAYSEAMHSGILPRHLHQTHAWHTSHRAKSILSRLPDLYINDKDYISHHLSIELSPLHSATSLEVEGYVAANIEDVVAHSLRFASDASRHTTGTLRGIVIVRCTASRFLNMFSSHGAVSCSPDQDTAESPCWFRFDLPGFEDVKFVCVWGARNNLAQKSMEKIINTINNKISNV